MSILDYLVELLPPKVHPELPETIITIGPVEDVLRRAQDRIRDPQHWMRQRLDNGDSCGNGATRWCARGSVMKEIGKGRWPKHDPTYVSANDLLNKAGKELHPQGFSRFSEVDNDRNAYVYVNNYVGHEEVMRVFDRAICDAREQGV